MKNGTCVLSILLLSALAAWAITPPPAPGTRARYFVLTGKHNTPPPIGTVDLLYGPREKIGRQEYQWWQLEARTEPSQSTTPLFVLRALTARDPLDAPGRPLGFARYQLFVPELDERLEYVDVHSGRALLPAWDQFETYFVPHAAAASRHQHRVPETAEFLGHVLTLFHAGTNVTWPSWPEPKILRLDRELLVGTGRNFKDREGHRLPQQPQRQNYNYVQFEPGEYRTMIEAGINLFTVSPQQEAWVRTEPVFYLRGSAKGRLRYPVDLYRANYVGPVMFMDEPSILMVGDTNIHRTLRYFSDAAALIAKRTRSTYESTHAYGSLVLERMLEQQGANLGDMRLKQVDFPSWETLYETAFYQFAGGARGIVHEGRYQLEPFNRAFAKWTGRERTHSAREMLQYHYAFLRGAARHFGGFWGTSIYGQADPAIAPEALTLAYDMGARYCWFWTSDHDHHVPWPEQLALARTLKAHATQHPRPSIYGAPPKLDTVILIPNGYFLSFENLWWVRVLDKEGKNEASQAYRRLMQRALLAIEECFKRGDNFDVAVDDGRAFRNYRRIVRVDDEPQ